MAEKSFIDEVMDFDPQRDERVFTQVSESANVDSKIYKTLPKTSKSEDGHYHAKIRFVMNPFDSKQSLVHQVRYSMQDENGFFSAISPLSIGDKNCPLFKAWKTLHFSGDAAKDEFAKKEWEKRESDWGLVQIIEDENFPELVGQFKIMKFARDIVEKINAKMNPSKDSKKGALRLNDYLFGNVLEMDVKPGPKDPQHPERETREISYAVCDFSSDIQPIIKTDGTPLFDEDQVEVIENYSKAYNYVKAQLAKSSVEDKTEKEKAALQKAQDKMDGLKEQMREMYTTAIEYAKENCPSLIDECSYKPWDELLSARVQKWIDYKLAQANGTALPSAPVAQTVPLTSVPASKPAPKVEETAAEDDDLPF